ncbi:hypothetical protein D9M69_454870 [compost metagenome]
MFEVEQLNLLLHAQVGLHSVALEDSRQQQRQGGHTLLTVNQFQALYRQSILRLIDADDRAKEVVRLVFQQIVEQRIPLHPIPGVLALVAWDGVDHPAFDIEQGRNGVVVNRLDHSLAMASAVFRCSPR